MESGLDQLHWEAVLWDESPMLWWELLKLLQQADETSLGEEEKKFLEN